MKRDFPIIEKLKLNLQQWAKGRHGNDALNYVLVILALVTNIFALIFHIFILDSLAFLLLWLSLYRSWSRDIAARRRENSVYLEKTAKIRKEVQQLIQRVRDKEHTYFRCPQCEHQLRVPKGVGTIRVTCTCCRHSFLKKTTKS